MNKPLLYELFTPAPRNETVSRGTSMFKAKSA
jgi:hypothetical protein